MERGCTPIRCRIATRDIVGAFGSVGCPPGYDPSPLRGGVYDFVSLNNGSGNPAVVME